MTMRIPILKLNFSVRKADKDDLINDAAAIAESIQPKGNTLSSTNVVTPVPVLLKHTLREYQVRFRFTFLSEPMMLNETFMMLTTLPTC